MSMISSRMKKTQASFSKKVIEDVNIVTPSQNSLTSQKVVKLSERISEKVVS